MDEQSIKELPIKRKLFSVDDTDKKNSSLEVSKSPISPTEKSPDSSPKKPEITEIQSDTISCSTSTLTFFNENIFARFDKAMHPILAFIKKINIFKAKYEYLLKSLGCKYNRYSFAAVNRIEIENRDPNTEVSYDSCMDSFFNSTESLAFKMTGVIEVYFPLINSSQNTLAQCIEEINDKIKKLQTLSNPTSSLDDFIKLKDKCSALSQNITVQKKLLITSMTDLVKVNKILASDGILNEETADQQKTIISNYIFNGLIKDCNQTPIQANTFLSEEKANRFINKLVLINTQCNEKNLAFCALDGFIENLQKVQQENAISSSSNKHNRFR